MPAPAVALPARRRRWRLALWIVLGLSAVLALMAALVPLAVRSIAQDQLSERLGRQVTLAAVRFNPLTLALQVDDLRIAGPKPGAEPLLTLKQLSIDADLRSLLRMAPVIEAVHVDSPRLQLARTGEGQFDIDDIVHRLAAQPAGDPDAPPPRFALYNLRITDGQCVLDDQPKRQIHRIEALQLGLPFLSNMDDAVAVKVQPRLAFVLGGGQFDTGALATPFARDRASQVHLDLKSLDIGPWLPYLPAGLPVRPTAGKLAVDLRLDFSQPPDGAARVILAGELVATGVALADARGEPLGGWDHLRVALADVQPLRQQVGLDSVDLDGARLALRRDALGRLNLPSHPDPAVPGGAVSAPASKQPVRPAASSGSVASKAAPAAESPPSGWRLALARLAVKGLQVDWTDQQVRPAVQWQAAAVDVTASDLAWPLPAAEHASRWQLSASLAPAAAATDAASLQWQGELSADGGQAQGSLERLSLSWAAPYLAEVLTPRVSGQVALKAGIRWQGLPGAEAPELSLSSLRVDDLALRAPGAPAAAAAAAAAAPSRLTPVAGAPPLAGWRSLELLDARIVPAQRQIELGRLTIRQPQLDLRRGADGQFNVQQWLAAARPASAAGPGDVLPVDAAAPSAAAAAPASHRGAATPAAQATAWRLLLNAVAVDGGQLHWRDDAAGPEPVLLDIAGFQLAAGSWQWPAGKGSTRLQGSLSLSSPAAAPAPAALRPVAPRKAGPDAARLAPGQLQWTGQMAMEPLSWRGQVQAERLPVHLLAPYLGQALPVAVMRAEASWRGGIEVSQAAAGWSLALQGDARLGDLKLQARRADAAADDELLSWQALALQGLKLAVAPGSRPSLEIAQASLADFFARLVITEQGRLNLTDLAPPPAEAASSAPGAASAPTVVLAATPAASAAPDAAAPGAARSVLPVDLALGGIELQGGRIDFSDRFIRPNYRADLSELQGRIGAFRSDAAEMATLELRGRAAGTALLDIRGAINPTVNPLVMDIQARATDLELAPLSPYAGKYAGYAIERGKLSMDVSYRIQPDGKLEAKNQIVLNQLTFGERIESPDATKLPVLLAVALLKDRHGVIDLNLPIGGSINDPQFSVGGLILKVILNLLGKALTAPFALLSGGGGDELSVVEFMPGTAVLMPTAEPVIAKMAQALTDRPALKMTVTGASDLQSEREAMQAAQLESRLLAEQRKDMLRNGEPTDAAAPALSPAERTRLLAKVYADTRLPDKPRNMVGLAKEVPPAEMEALLKASYVVTTDTARELALQRGLAVRDALVARGLSAERLFLAAPRLRSSAEDDARWTPRVQLSLGTQ